ncbi:MAG: alpha/beta hydrolase family protein [Gemmobacter sp.]
MTLSLHQFGDWGPVYGPEGGNGLPAVVILHGSEGPMAGWSHRFAAILAAHGLLALPLSYGRGDFWSAGRIEDEPLDRVIAAGAALADHPRAGRVGLLGWSKGGEMALLVGSLMGPGAPFACVAAHAPTGLVTGAFDPDAFRAGIAAGAPRLATDPAGPRAWVWPGKDDRLAPGAPIPIEDCPVPVFLSIGTADPVVDPARTLALADRLAAAGRPADLLEAEGQGHGYDFDTEPVLWRRLLSFFDRHLGPRA